MMIAQQKMETKISGLKVEALKEMAIALYADTREGTDIVLSFVLDALMVRLPEDQFVAFCDEVA